MNSLIAESLGETLAKDQTQFERKHAADSGLGSLSLRPAFDVAARADCHQNVVTGAGSPFTELRAGRIDARRDFATPRVPIYDGNNMMTGRSLVNDRAVCEAASERPPDSENISSLRAVASTLCDRFIEGVDDHTLLAMAANQPVQNQGKVPGEAIQIPSLEAPGHLGLGKFGRKDEWSTVLLFLADAYLIEMGVLSRLRPNALTQVCEVNNGVQDIRDDLGLENIDHFAQFIRGTKAQSLDNALAATPDAQAGHGLFISIGCATCQVETPATAPVGTGINGATYGVAGAIGNKISQPFGGFLLHDVGTGDGIVQAGRRDTANKLRTAPLGTGHPIAATLMFLKSS